MDILYKGELLKDFPVIDIQQNGAFMYGDSFFETMLVHKGSLPFAKFHWDRIEYACKVLQMPNPFESYAIFQKQAHDLVEAKNYTYSMLRLQVWRDANQGYRAENGKSNWILQRHALNKEPYLLNINGLRLGSYHNQLKSTSSLSTIKSGSAQLLVLATIYAKKHGFDDVLIHNTAMNPIETTRSNIFSIHKDSVITPPLTDGCLNGIMRRVIKDICKSSGITFTEKTFHETFLKNAKEVFITSSIRGIQWVESIEDYTFEKGNTTTFLVEKLKEKLN